MFSSTILQREIQMGFAAGVYGNNDEHLYVPNGGALLSFYTSLENYCYSIEREKNSRC
jgi:hypothetical protein